MTSDVVLLPFPTKHLELGNARLGLADRARFGRVSGVLALAMAAMWCAAGPQAQTRSSSAKAPAHTETPGGGSQYYDVLGKRYSVLTSSNVDRERGGASWYGHPF